MDLEQQQQHREEEQHEHSRDCMGCIKCRDNIEKILASCSGASDSVTAKLKSVPPSAYVSILFLLGIIALSAVALGVALSAQRKATTDCYRPHYDVVRIKCVDNGTAVFNHTNAIIPLSADPRERNIQLWKLHNSKVLEVPDDEVYVSGRTQ
jgi:hypothetical protein